MSLLVLHLPPRPRLHPSRGEQPGADPAASVAELSYVLSPDGERIDESGRSAPALLPGRGRGTTSVIAVLCDSATSWHRITCPKAPPAKLRAALVGLLEEELLEEPENLHLALQPGAQPGDATWVAVTDRHWLQGQLQALEQAGLSVDRVVPGAVPADGPGHVSLLHAQTCAEAEASPDRGDRHDQLCLTWSHPLGVTHWRAHGTLAQRLLPRPLSQDLRLSASPAASSAAQHWLGQPLPIQNPAARLLQSVASGWNLRQFDLATGHRGTALLRDAHRELFGPAWRPVRVGLIALLLLQLLGLNAWAWLQKSQLQSRREAMTALLRSTHPQVRAILDAPVQMRRETESLRASAGRAGDNDLETLLQVAASAWPARLTLQTLRFEPGQLTLQSGALVNDDIQQMREQLRAGGWQVEGGDGRLTLRPPAGAR